MTSGYRQWGRGQTAAERAAPGGPWPLTTCRQWGRGQTAAESSMVSNSWATTESRQWGRGQTAAESAPSSPRPTGPTAVNGAAAKRPRKG